MRRANSRAPRRPDSSPVKATNITVAGSGFLRDALRAASRIIAVPDVLSSAPGPSARESKCAPTTYTNSGFTVPFTHRRDHVRHV